MEAGVEASQNAAMWKWCRWYGGALPLKDAEEQLFCDVFFARYASGSADIIAM
jgi:Rieske Fe-S protein